MFDQDRSRLWPWLFVLAFMAVIFCLSTAAFTSQQTALLFGPLNHLARKAAHFIEYAALFVLVRWALGCCVRQPRTVALAFVALLICVVYAASDEWHQLFVPGRTSSVWDVLLDSTGAAFGCLAWSLVQSFRRN
jgi:VanZ family protein